MQKNRYSRPWKIISVVALIVFLLIVIVFLLQKAFFSGAENILYDSMDDSQTQNVLKILKNENISGFQLDEGRVSSREINDTEHIIAYVKFVKEDEKRNYVIDLDSSKILISAITHYFDKKTVKS